ncbi:amidohydrolase family protein [Algoriphagus halophytocola]|uniref:Amidohydrolase family protein n=1 Tax=Algoriphagus halophytocola TaxID=2991499 RepID=A0ABY6MN22_9BACT|nr:MULTISPECIES: amidohydrolase family protein [unclassified Algoriphagus]UZD23726.1 amidohydrolase family protein [Algoriphagus sp. TR-M5]WBL45020.1 amidohydrolase family protein [Algoriphagus sp. TR-M9]
MRKTLLRAGVFCLMVSGWISSYQVNAQSDPTGKRPITDTHAITNATVFATPDASGVKGDILIKNGLIQGVGANLSIPAGAKVIAGDSLFIYPGFITAGTDAGITKPADPEKPENFISSNPPDEIAGITPWRSAVDQFSMDSKVEDLRKAGFTIAQLIPDGGMIPGKTAIVALGSSYSTNVLLTNTALAANFNGARGMYPGTAVGVMAKFRDVYKNTQLTSQRSASYASQTGLKRPEITPTFNAMAEVVSGNIPVMFSANEELEILRAISLSKELGFKLILTDLEEYEEVLEEIKASSAQVLIKLELPDDKAVKAQEEDKEPSDEVKARYARVKEAYENALAQASKLEEAGIPFAFTTVGVKSNDISKTLRKMIENGLTEEMAMAALTTNAAEILGISKAAGTIAKGKMANLVLATEPIFSEDAQIKHVMVDGYLFDYETKTKKKAKEGDSDGTVQIAGNWDYTSESPAGSSSGTLMIKKEGSEYTGTISYDDPSGSGKVTSPIVGVKLEGQKLSFSFEVVASGMTIMVDVAGDVDGSSYDATMTVAEYGSFPFEGTLNPTLIATK